MSCDSRCVMLYSGNTVFSLLFFLMEKFLDASCNIRVIQYLAYFSSSWKSGLVMCLPICLMRVPISNLVELDRFFTNFCINFMPRETIPK
jgi:hypothetical protein